MIKSEKKLKELTALLNKKNNIVTTKAIKSLRDEEPFEGVIGLLVTLFNDCEDRSLRKTIEEFFNDIRDQSVCLEVIEAIRKPWKPVTISMLVASCWQSGMDYSDYLPDMVNIFLKSDYATAIECMTVIEESAARSTREKKDEIIRMIEERPLSGSNEKSALTLELISILEK